MPIFKIINVADKTEAKLETTRWVVKTRVKDTTWGKLIKRLQLLFDTKSTKFFVSWYDGTDYCSIRDWKDLQGAVEFFAESNESPDKAIRLYASLTKRDLPTIFAEGSPKDADLASELQFDTVEDSELDTESVLSSDINPVDEVCEMLETTDIQSDEEAASVDTNQSIGQLQDDKLSAQLTPVPVVETCSSMIAPAQMMGQPMPQFNYYGMGPSPHMYPMMIPQWTPMFSPGQQFPQTILSEQSIQTEVSPAVPAVVPVDDRRASGITDNITQPSFPSSLPEETPSAPAAPVTLEPTTSTKHHSKKDSAKVESHKAESKIPSTKMTLDVLRGMGYTYEEKKLKPVIKAKKGNLNEIIDEINKW